jgi:hypothetical protein
VSGQVFDDMAWVPCSPVRIHVPTAANSSRLSSAVPEHPSQEQRNMARTWLSIRVELVGGMHAPDLWPRPGRLLLARPGMTFRDLAVAIDDAFARWDLSHLHVFHLADGTRIGVRTPWDEYDDEELDDRAEKLSRLQLGERFAYEFDLGDSWMHLCTVGEEKVDPAEVYGERPVRPVPYAGWGAIPDQYGRRWDADDGESPVPPPPDPPLSDLPSELHYSWGPRPSRVDPAGHGEGPWPDASRRGDLANVITGPWTHLDGRETPLPPPAPWTYEAIQDLRSTARQLHLGTVADLLLRHDPLEVAHVVAPALLHGVEVGSDPIGLVVLRLTPRLSKRGWLGDDELVAEFERVGRGEPGELRPTPVDLDELAYHLDGPTDFDEGSRLEIATGQLWPTDPEVMAGTDEPEDFEDPEAFIHAFKLGPGPGYGDMEAFIATVTDERLASRLEDAIQGHGAFRRFKDAVHADDLWWSAWLTFSSERQLARARWWLADAGFRPSIPGEHQG